MKFRIKKIPYCGSFVYDVSHKWLCFWIHDWTFSNFKDADRYVADQLNWKDLLYER